MTTARVMAPLSPAPNPLQLNPHVGQLSLYDIAGTPGVACDISHCNTKAIAKVCTAPMAQLPQLRACVAMDRGKHSPAGAPTPQDVHICRATQEMRSSAPL